MFKIDDDLFVYGRADVWQREGFIEATHLSHNDLKKVFNSTYGLLDDYRILQGILRGWMTKL